MPATRSLLHSHWVAGALAFLLLAPVHALREGPKTGTIEGHIRDQSGVPIAGAQVRLDHSPLGAVADTAGHYLIPKVPVGTYGMLAQFVGYKPSKVVDLVVTKGKTTTWDFALEQQAVDIGEIEVTSATGQMQPRDAVTTKQLVDGAPVAAGRGNAFVGTNAMEEASVTTGAAGAEFGNAQSGVIGLQPGLVTPRPERDAAGEEYHRIYENRFLEAASNPLSTFSIDVDAASYSNVRSFLNENTLPPADAVRVEEFINYFPYDYPEPTDRHPFSVTLERSACPWNTEHQLLLVGLQGKHLDPEELPPSNLVFLLDVSGSMDEPNKLPLVKRAFELMVPRLRPQDRVAIVVYAGAAGLVLPSTPGSHKQEILAALNRLEAGGSTAGAEGIQLAYDVARRYFKSAGNNRVILATDGDFNVGPSSESELIRIIEKEREDGIFLTVLGFGTGNLRDAMMEQLADKGNGHYAYVDGEREARKVFVDELSGTLLTIAKDVKLQLEWNPLRVKSYRLVGYENRVLAKEDFDDDRKDAGDMGAGHSVTALYEIVPARFEEELSENPTGQLRYQNVALSDQARLSNEWLTLKLRYKDPKASASRLLSRALTDDDQRRRPSETFRFASAVAEFGLLLRDSEFRGNASAPRLIARARDASHYDPEGYRAEFVQLVEKWRELKGYDRD
ncbi:MAG: von Willebrand factor type A domain-containing protein [Gemmatimonadales bacterium]